MLVQFKPTINGYTFLLLVNFAASQAILRAEI